MSWAKIVFPEFIGHLLLQFCRSMTFWNVKIDKKHLSSCVIILVLLIMPFCAILKEDLMSINSLKPTRRAAADVMLALLDLAPERKWLQDQESLPWIT
jgi:ABC-type phosphate transport system permease subunit